MMMNDDVYLVFAIHLLTYTNKRFSARVGARPKITQTISRRRRRAVAKKARRQRRKHTQASANTSHFKKEIQTPFKNPTQCLLPDMSLPRLSHPPWLTRGSELSRVQIPSHPTPLIYAASSTGCPHNDLRSAQLNWQTYNGGTRPWTPRLLHGGGSPPSKASGSFAITRVSNRPISDAV